MGFIRLKVRTRIFLGFAALVVLSVAIAVFGVVQFGSVDTNLRKMDALAADTQRVLDVARELEAIRRAGTHALLDATEDALADQRTHIAKANALLADGIQAAASDERRKLYQQAQNDLRADATDTGQFAQLSAAWLDARGKLFAGDDALSATTDKLVGTLRATASATLGDAADRIESAVLLVRVANWRFVATQDKAGISTLNTNVANARDALAALQGHVVPEIAALVPPASAALASYATDFAAYSSARLASLNLYNDRMRPRIIAMQQQLDTARNALVSEFGQSRIVATGAVSTATWMQEILAVIALIAGAALALFIGSGIVRPITAMTGVMSRLAAGEHGIDVPSRDNRDEIGDMARAVEVFKQQAIEAERLATEQNAGRAAKERRQAAMEQHTRDFGTSISGVMASLASSAENMRRAADAMSDASSTVHTEAHTTAGGTAKASQDLTTVAAAVEELTSSVAEISRQVSSAAEVARQAVERAEASRTTMQGLSEATARIGDVVHLISDIAGQTNLLALNATIEAALAGEAGKGFAVVAGEVKTLAAQTAKATAEIGTQIETVRTATGDAVAAMSEIGSIIGQMDQVSTAISAAVEEQSATTQELAANVQAVSHATADTSKAMEHVVTVADNAGALSRDVLTGAAEISREAETLRTQVDQFLRAVREDTGDDNRRAA